MIAGSGLCSSFKRELLEGRHDFRSHVFQVALYTADAPLDVDATTVYITQGEITGPGYSAGGMVLGGVQLLGPTARAAYVTWDDPIWNNSTLTARAALIYNQSAQQRAVCILDFTEDKSSNLGPFRIKLPPPAPSTALVRLL
ncbi:MAG TPA: hypothetical protein VKB77_08330 [Terriglobales bacterium]|nr:hypothetical protein [Terriglobales bacterium]